MNRQIVVTVVVLLSVAGGGALLAWNSVSGGTPGAPAGEATTTTATDADAEAPATRTDTSDGDGGVGTSATTPSDSGYALTIETVENCGRTCRDVTARLDNTVGAAREDVRVTTEMYADGDLLWSGDETVGRLGPGESRTLTARVDVGFSGGLAISANDGYVTIVTVVRSENGTARFSERRKVA